MRVLRIALVTTAAFLPALPAHAIPLYARQTGQQCAACHIVFPELTPYGRLFKLNGYTFGGGQSSLPPVSAMMVASFTHTQADQLPSAAPHFAKNDNVAYDFASLFYGGVLLPHVGMFGQITYDNIGKNLSWDNTDLRFVDSISVDQKELLLGIDVNNNPTVQDVWNTVPAWYFPWLGSGLAPGPNASTLIEGGLAQQVVGVSAYAYWNRLIYAEFGLYRSLGNRLLYELGSNPGPPTPISGVAPYWRLAIEPKWGANTLEIGTFGLDASVVPSDISGFGNDHYTDIGFDAQYQHFDDVNSYILQGSFITEEQSNAASYAQGSASNRHNRLYSSRIMASYFYDQTYGGELTWFDINGSKDAALYSATSINNSPNSSGFIGELDWMPFNHGGPAFWPWLNVKFGLQYTYYTQFDGASKNYDGAGTNATANNTLYLFAWLAF